MASSNIIILTKVGLYTLLQFVKDLLCLAELTWIK